MYTARIEQVESVLVPGSQTDMRGVQSFLVSNNHDDVTVMNSLSEYLVIAMVDLGT